MHSSHHDSSLDCPTGNSVASSDSSKPSTIPVAIRTATSSRCTPPTKSDGMDAPLDIETVDPEPHDEVRVTRQVTHRRRPASRRDRGVPRSRTIARKKLTREDLRVGAIMYPPVEGVTRPRTRGECVDAPRPCPFVACSKHLYLDINPETGSIKLNFPSLEPWELRESCSLDVADRGAITLEETGELMNLTRERVRQLEVSALLKLKFNQARRLGAA
jgi:hypothetical protein